MSKYFFTICLLLLFAPVAVFAIDTDKDGLTDEQEMYTYYTDPNNADSDGDGFTDGDEVSRGFSPHVGSSTRMHQFDYDGDGLNDWLEIWFGSDIARTDTDGDGYSDFNEVMEGYDPTDSSLNRRFGDSRKIVVDRSTQQLGYFVDGVKIVGFPVSTGNPNTETPAGMYAVRRKIVKKDYRGPGYFVSDVTWNMEFLPMYYVHAAYWHNDFGVRTHSHGCVNMREKDAKLLYQYIDVGVPVEIIGKTPKNYRVEV